MLEMGQFIFHLPATCDGTSDSRKTKHKERCQRLHTEEKFGVDHSHAAVGILAAAVAAAMKD